jgi:hypothetical protein
VSVLTPEESRAVAQAGESEDGDDRHWRAVAGRTPARR